MKIKEHEQNNLQSTSKTSSDIPSTNSVAVVIEANGFRFSVKRIDLGKPQHLLSEITVEGRLWLSNKHRIQQMDSSDHNQIHNPP